MHSTRTGLIAAGTTILLLMTACGGGSGDAGGGGGGGGSGTSNVAPVANAGAPRTVDVNTVTLNGSASNDSDGTIASYAWTQTAGTPVTLNSASTAQPNFTAPQNTAASTFTFQLIVTDNRGATSNPSAVTITVTGNAAPVANAGAAQTVAAGASVALNGTASSDVDGTIGLYSWEQTAGTAVTLVNPTSGTPTFAAPVGSVASTVSFRLTVTDNRGAASAAAVVTISVNANVVPVANAGSARTVASGAAVALNGGASSDADGSVAAWSWAQTAGAAVTLNNAGTATPSFTAPVGSIASTLTFRLIVTDNFGATSAAATVTITVNANAAPVANAGSQQSALAGTAVTLNGTASSDSDGTIVSYAWTQTAGPAVTLNNSNTATPGFTSPVLVNDTFLTFQLIVTDNAGAVSAASTVNILAIHNFTPIAVAGPAQTVMLGATVTLDGRSSSDPGAGSVTGYSWTQTSGPAVVLTGANTAQPTFTAPATPATLVFALVVTDNFGATGGPATVTITVNPGVTVSGTIRFQRVLFLPGASGVLDYANPVWQPARGITVVASMSTGPGVAVVGTAVTDSGGNYSMTVPSNLGINLRAMAEMVRNSSQPLPRWNMRVQNGASASSPQSYSNGVFINSSVGTYNLDIPTGITANGGGRTGSGSSPFAALDTVYAAMQTVLAVAPNTSFPDLYVDWGGQSEGTFFDTVGGQHIAILSDLTQDSDEYDQHVIAHEFGHYIEHNFSRSDNIGGSHGLGDKLDMRVAFGEGFATAFAAIALNDPLDKDSYVLNGTLAVSTVDVEANPSGTAGCWCSEASVWSIFWDLHDVVPDGSDNITLPFSATWDVLVNQQRVTPSVTSIFSFITALKTTQPAFSGLINPLASGQNILSGAIDPFATNETFLPFPGMTLPLIPVITRGGGPVVVRSINDGGRYNKAGNRGFLQFTPATTGSVTVSLTTSNVAANRDPDFLVWKNGVLVSFGLDSSSQYPEVETFNVTAGETYIIDAYDCSNGCSSPYGTSGDYNLTVTIN